MDTAPADRRVGYVLSRFPKLSETFILREMDALEDLGWRVDLFSLVPEPEGRVHPAAHRWTPRAQKLPLLSSAVLAANLRALRRQPTAWAGLWGAVVRGYRRDLRSLVRALVLVPSSVRLAEVVRERDVPQLHAHYATYPLLACWVVHRLTRTPYTVTVHAHDLFTGTPMLAAKLRDARAVVAISDFNRRFLERAVPASDLPPVAVVHCGVDPARYGPRAERQGDVLDVLCVGSLQEYKGHLHLVEACRLLVARGVDVRCRLVGHGPAEAALRAAVSAAGLDGIVELLGPRDELEVAALLRGAHAYVQPSVVARDGQMEGIPVALMEALATGLPVVATDLSGVPELVRHGETGWLVPPADPTALADALDEIAQDAGTARRRGEAGRHLVAREFDLRANVERLSGVLSGAAVVDGRAA